jgi:DNA-binding MarR family transcriptional regulator
MNDSYANLSHANGIAARRKEADAMHGHHHGPDIPPVLDGMDPLAMSVFAAFRRSTHLNRQLMIKLMAEKGGHPGAAMVLRVLAGHDGISQRDLADILHVSRPNVTAILQKMEQAGLVERSDDEKDARLTRVTLTPEGRARSEEFRSAFASFVDTTIGAMPEADARELVRLLDQLSDNAEAALKGLCNETASEPTAEG